MSRPAERKMFFSKDLATSSSLASEGAVKGKGDSKKKSLMVTSRVWTLSSWMARPLMTALLPSLDILMRYCKEDCEWA